MVDGTTDNKQTEIADFGISNIIKCVAEYIHAQTGHLSSQVTELPEWWPDIYV